MEHRHPGFIRTAFSHEIKDRAATGLEGHKGWPGYYLVSIWPTFLPWSLILPLALVTAWKHRREPRVRFALAAVAGPWLMFEVVQTKLPHYLLPCFPPLAFLAADAIVRCLQRNSRRPPGAGASETTALRGLGDRRRRPHRSTRTAFLNAAVVWARHRGAPGAGALGGGEWFRPLPWVTTAAGVAGGRALYALSVAGPFRAGRPGGALAAMGVGMLGRVTAPVRPVPADRPVPAPLDRRRPRATRPGRDRPAAQAIMLDYKEPSLAFYQGGTIREETAMVATDRLLATCPPWLVMTDEVYRAERTDRSGCRSSPRSGAWTWRPACAWSRCWW